MNYSSLIRNELNSYKTNELIFASRLYRDKLASQVGEATFYKTLERMCRSGELVKIAKGTYHIPKVGKYGIVPPSEKEIVSAFTRNNTGTVIGYSLYNELELTTQVSKTVTVLSSALEGFSKSIRNVTVLQKELDYTEAVNNMIHGLEVLQNYYSIQDMNHRAFIRFAEQFAQSYDDDVFETVYREMAYKKSTLSFLREILDFYDRPNNISMYLSALSTYKHPTMEEIYETARKSE